MPNICHWRLRTNLHDFFKGFDGVFDVPSVESDEPEVGEAARGGQAVFLFLIDGQRPTELLLRLERNSTLRISSSPFY